jgi:uncharacterized protein
MGRLILVGLIIVLVVWLLKRALAAPKSGQPPEAGGQPGDLVACAHCGVNLPKAEARSAGGRFFCSEEHWRAGPKDS